MIKALFYIFIALTCISHSAQAQGAGTSGGGDVVIDVRGNALLVDLLPKAHKASYLTVDEIKQKYFESKPISKYVFKSAPSNFLSCSLEKLSSNSDQYPVFEFIKNVASNLDIAFTEAFFENNQFVMLRGLPGSTVSSRIPSELQVPVALFQYQTLVVSERLYNRLNQEHRCALGVHELLRLLNFYLSDSESLSTTDIENMIRVLFLNEVHEETQNKFRLLRVKSLSLGEILDSINEYESKNILDPKHCDHLTDAKARLECYQKLLEQHQQKQNEDLAKLMHDFQRAFPGYKQAPPTHSNLFLDSELDVKEGFSLMLRSRSWRNGKTKVKFRFNVITYQLESGLYKIE